MSNTGECTKSTGGLVVKKQAVDKWSGQTVQCRLGKKQNPKTGKGHRWEYIHIGKAMIQSVKTEQGKNWQIQ